MSKMRISRVFRCLLALVLVSPLAFSTSVAAARPAPERIEQMAHRTWREADGMPTGATALAQAPDGTLWIGTRAGLFIFDGLKFTAFHTNDGATDLPKDFVHSLAFDAEGTLWVSFETGGLASIRDEHVRAFEDVDGVPIKGVTSLTLDPTGFIWVYFTNHIATIKADGQPHLLKIKNPQAITVLYAAHDGKVWVGDANGLSLLSKSRSDLVKTPLPMGVPLSIAEVGDGTLLISDFDTANRLGRTRHIASDGSLIEQLPGHDVVQSLLVGQDGSVWMSSQTTALLHRVPRDASGSYANESGGGNADTFGSDEGLASGTQAVLLEDKDRSIWVAAQDGLDLFHKSWILQYPNLANGTSGLCFDETSGLWVWDTTASLKILKNGVTQIVNKSLDIRTALCHNSKSQTWVLDSHGPGFIADKIFSYLPAVPGFKDYNYQDLLSAPDGSLYLVSLLPARGFWHFVGGQWLPVSISGLPRESPVAEFFDSSGRLWLSYLLPESRVVFVEHGVVNNFTLQDKGIAAAHVFLEMPEGMLIGGSNGLAFCNHNSCRNLKFSPSVSSRMVLGLAMAAGDLWILGSRGVLRISGLELQKALVQDNVILRPTTIAGGNVAASQYHGRPTNRIAVEPGGLLWFAGQDKIFSLDPSRPTLPPKLSSLRILSASADGKAFGANGVIPPRPHMIAINYLGVSLIAPETVTYRYKLLGFDAIWQDAGHRMDAIYTGLPQGAYRFAVQASVQGGAWSDTTIGAPFTVQAAFDQTIWFRLLLLAMLATAILTAVKLRIDYVASIVRTRADSRAGERLRIARELHDTLLQSVQGLLLRFQAVVDRMPVHSPEHAQLEGALDYADRVVSEGRQRVIDLRAADTRDLIERISVLAKDYAPRDAARLEIVAEGSPVLLNHAVADELTEIAAEAIRNAYNHAAANAISVQVQFGSRRLMLRVKDDGIGFDAIHAPPSRNEHFGLVGMRERAARIGATFSISTTPGGGCTIAASLPASVAYNRQKIRVFWR